MAFVKGTHTFSFVDNIRARMKHITRVANTSPQLIFVKVTSEGYKEECIGCLIQTMHNHAFSTSPGRVKIWVYKHRSSGDYADAKPECLLESNANRSFIVKQISSGNLVVEGARRLKVRLIRR